MSAILADFVANVLGTHTDTFIDALKAGLILPDDVNASKESEVSALVMAIRREYLPPYIPPPVMKILNSFQLWDLCVTVPEVADLLAEKIANQTFKVRMSNQYNQIRTAPAVVKKALVKRLMEGTLDENTTSIILKSYDLLTSDELAAYLLLKKSLSSKRATETRRINKAALKASGGKIVKVSPLGRAIASGRRDKIMYWDLAAITLSQLERELPAWLAASPKIKAYLLRVPVLPVEYQLDALEAYAESEYSFDIVPPVDISVVKELSPPALGAFLSRLMHDCATMNPPLEDTTFQELIFRIIFSDANLAASIQNAHELRKWRTEVKQLPPPLTEEELLDDEARWVELFAKTNSTTTQGLLLLRTRYAEWPDSRKSALASAITTLLDTELCKNY